MGILNYLTLGLAGGAASKNATKTGTSNYYTNLLNSLAPHMKLLSDIGGQQTAGANADFAKSGAAYDEVLKYIQTIMSGSREDLLKNLDASQITKAYDEQSRQNYELAPRGGRRAANAANIEMSKMAELNKLLQYLRGQAPGQLMQVAQGLGGQANARQMAAIQSLLGVTGLRATIEGTQENISQAEKDRKAAMIGSIIGAAGGAAGTYFGSR